MSSMQTSLSAQGVSVQGVTTEVNKLVYKSFATDNDVWVTRLAAQDLEKARKKL